MRNNKVIIIAGVLGIAIVAITYIGASRMSGDEKGNDNQKILSPVKNGSRGVVVFGTIDVDNGAGLVPVYPEMFPQPCKVKKVLVKEGDNVEFDDVLIDFDSELANIKVDEARAGVAKAQSVLKGAEAILAQAILNDKMQELAIAGQQLQLKSQETKLDAARIDLEEKKRKLRGLNVTMDPEVIAAEKAVESAQQALDGEKKKLEAMKIGNLLSPISISRSRAEAGIDEAKNAIAVQEAQLQLALYGKKLMTLKAPVAGKIMRSVVTEGMSFGAQTRAPAFMIQSKGPIVVRAEVDQEFASRVVRGQDAIITDDGNANLRWTGKVIRVSDGFLPKRGNMSPEGLMLNDVRVLECIVSIDANSGSTPVRVGQRVKVSIGVE